MTDEHPTHRFLCSTSPGVEDPDDPPVVTPATPTFSSGLVTSRATFPSLPRHRRRTRRSTTLTAPPLPPPPPRFSTANGHHHDRKPPLPLRPPLPLPLATTSSRHSSSSCRLTTSLQTELRGIFFIYRSCRAIKPRKNLLHHPIRTSYDRVALSTVGSDGHYSR